MVLKRRICEEGAGSGAPIREPKRRLPFSSVVRDAVRAHRFHVLTSEFETLIRRVLREEVGPAILRSLHSSPRPSPNHIEASGARAWQLHFDDKVPSTLFTGSKIESEDSKPIRIVVRDASSKKIIESGPLSKVKIEVCVLNGDFGADDLEEWSENDFRANVIRERDGKRPLLAGNRMVTFSGGVGCIGEISFTDNSSWTRSRKFRLGARVLTTLPEVPELTERRIREARTEAFVVKDHRGELYKKHHPPCLGDEIWRLDKIAKDGVFHRRLADNKIYTVKDFLRLYVTNPSALRHVFGGVPNKAWETITEHAVTCVLEDNEFYTYSRDAERVGLVLNSIYKVVGATFDGQTFQSPDKLTFVQKQLVKDLKRHAYKNLNDLVQVDAQTVALLGPQADPYSVASLDLLQSYLPIEEQGTKLCTDESEMLMSFNHAPAPPYTFEVEDNNQFEDSMAQNFHPTHPFNPTLRNSFILRNFFSGPYDGGNYWATSGPLEPGVQPDHLAADVTYHGETSTWVPITTAWTQGIGAEVGFVSNFPNIGIPISRSEKPKAGWCKLRAAIKWGIIVRRDVAAKRMANLLLLDI